MKVLSFQPYAPAVFTPSPGKYSARFVEALRYKPEGRRLDSQWCHWDFSLA
jgi:hypothetical protein